MMEAKLAFYVAEKGTLMDKLVAWWTRSRFSHVELIVDGLWTSTSSRTLVLNKREIVPTDKHWEYVSIDIDENRYNMLLNKYMGCKYDWVAIFLTQLLPLDVEDPKRLMCSEWCGMVMGLSYPHKNSPGELYDICKGEDDDQRSKT